MSLVIDQVGQLNCHVISFSPEDLSHIPMNNGAESRSGWTKIQEPYANVHPMPPHAGTV